MKNRYILLLFTLFFVVTGSVAQDGAVIVSGTVYDKAGNNETFPGVNIICRDAKTQKRIRGLLPIWKEDFPLRFLSVQSWYLLMSLINPLFIK